ncbi:MAG: ABC transporter ATP-binding protein [Methanobacteriaceae archaeon]|nr:ABC transporter ATP-binding protein [Candidatus Methanorudis spinitermitis]
MENLSKKFDNMTAVDNISFNIEEGEVFGFVGPNGAGKTTTIRMLTCLISSTSGTAKIAGYDINKKSDTLKIRKMIGLIPDNVGLYNELSAYKNLDFCGKLYGMENSKREENIKYFLKMLGIWDKKDIIVGKFSKGMKQKLAIARALIHDPEILFLDEPTANLDPSSSKTVRNFLIDLKQENKTIFINTHNFAEVQQICDKIGIMNTKLLRVSTQKDFKESIWGIKTIVQLDKVTDSVLNALNNVSFKNMSVSGDKLIFDLNDPQKENPAIINTIVNAGGRILYVTKLDPSLEDTYLKFLREEN